MHLLNIPIPPSVNKMYKTVRIKTRAGFIYKRGKGEEMRLWERDMAVWAVLNADALRQVSQYVKQNLRVGTVLRVDASFYFKIERIMCKDGKPKRLDTSNYLKALHDVIAALIGVDDCYFFDGEFRKRMMEPSRPECVDVIIQLIQIPELIDANKKR